MAIKYPIIVAGIHIDQRGASQNSYDLTGKLVSVRPCSDNPEDKTYVGIFLGELIRGAIVFHSTTTNELRVVNNYNPAIFVPALNKIVWGCGSFWRPIKKRADLEKAITDLDINNTPYVKLLQLQLETMQAEEEPEAAAL